MKKRGWNVIFNPSAGGIEDDDAGRLSLSRLGKLNLLATSRKGDALRYARQIRELGGGKIIVIGGDGTLNEVINGLAPDFDGIEMAVLPGGTGNDFCRGLEIPGEMEEAIEALCSRMEPRSIDVGRIRFQDQVRYFLNTSAGGFSVLVDRNLDEPTKKNWGSVAYYVSAIQALPDLQSLPFQAKFESGSEMQTEVYAWVITNGRYIAGGIPIAIDAQVDDGLLDLVLIPSLPVTKVPSLVSEVLLDSDKEGSDSGLIKKQASYVEIETQPPCEFNVDGEVAGLTPVIYEVVLSALRVYQPV